MSKPTKVVIGLVVFTLLFCTVKRDAGAYPLLNGGFADSSGWVTVGSVTIRSGYAELSDAAPYNDVTLYQGVSVTEGNQYTLSFDFQPVISTVDLSTEGAFSDLFSTSIYFNSSDQLSFNKSTALFDVNGSSFTPTNGSIIDSTTLGYTGYSCTFTALDNWLFPTFDFYDLDSFTGGYARVANVRLDEMSAAPVPEPSTFLLLAGGGVFLLVSRMRRRN